MDISLAQAHMRTPCEGVPHGADNFDWSRNPVVIMGANPTASGLPAWWSGPRYDTWPRILAWFTVYREAGSKEARNTRVAVRNLALWLKSKKTGQWSQIDAAPVPIGGAHYVEDMAGDVHQAWATRQETDGSLSVRPTKGYCAHGWGTMRQIDPMDVSGVYASLEHRIIADNPEDAETRLADRWLVNVGVDFYPSADSEKIVPAGSFCGRYIRAVPEWRESSGVA